MPACVRQRRTHYVILGDAPESVPRCPEEGRHRNVPGEDMTDNPTSSSSTRRTPLPRFPYGAVYFRKSNPPREDWARDYAVASEDGMNLFRHWFMWSAIEVAPGEYDWDDYDRQLDLAAEHGIKTIV